ncbi:MAG: cytochrome c biogenesis protein CcsA [Pseudomonadota bacterium]|nr:cytochrome c biogenesis protein CcsA [Pseudomonadota bacterium]
MIDLVLYLITAVLYGLLGSRDLILQRRTPASLSQDEGSYAGERDIHRLIPLAWITHVLLLQHTLIRPDRHLDLSVGHAISLIGAMTVAVYWVGGRRTSLGILRPTVLFLTSLSSLVPLLLPSQKPVSFSQGLAFELHIAVSLLAYSLFVIAALHATLMAMQERRLHAGDLGGRWGRLPPLLAMDAILFRLVLTGFVLLTLTLLSGVLFSEELFGRPFKFTHKNLLGVFSWGIFAFLLIGRWGYGWRGKRAVRWTLAGFAILVLAYVGQKVVLEIVLHRA